MLLFKDIFFFFFGELNLTPLNLRNTHFRTPPQISVFGIHLPIKIYFRICCDFVQPTKNRRFKQEKATARQGFADDAIIRLDLIIMMIIKVMIAISFIWKIMMSLIRK